MWPLGVYILGNVLSGQQAERSGPGESNLNTSPCLPLLRLFVDMLLSSMDIVMCWMLRLDFLLYPSL